MIAFRLPSVRTNRFFNILAVALVLLAAGGLDYAFRQGPPSRIVFSSLVAVLLVTPVLLRWQSAWMLLFLFAPLVTFVRRFYLLFDPDVSTYSFDAMTVLPEILIGTATVGMWLSSRIRKQAPLAVPDGWLRLPITAFIVVCVIEIFNPYMASAAAGVNGFRQFALWTMMYFICQQAITKREHVERWVLLTMVLAAGSGLYGAYQYIVGFPVWDMVWAEAFSVTNQQIGEQMRAFSTFGFTSTFSHYMVVGCCLGLVALTLQRVDLFTKLLTPFFLAAMVAGLALTFVRSSYMGLMAAVLVGVVVAGNPKARMWRLAACVLLVGALTSAVPKGNHEAYAGTETTSQLVANRVMSLSSPTEAGSMQARFTAWDTIFWTSFTMPVGRGLGSGAAGTFTGNYALGAAVYSESQFFSVLAELGWPGMVLFLWIVLYGFVFSIRVHDQLQDRDLRRLARGCLMVQVGLSVIGITGGVVLYTIPGSIYYWTALGIVTVLPRLEPARAELEAA